MAVTVTTLAGTTIGMPGYATAAPVACPWLARAQPVLDGLQGNDDPRATRLVPALQRAIATCQSSSNTERPYFQQADWLWSPIVDDPVLDPESDAMVKDLASGDEYIANIGDF